MTRRKEEVSSARAPRRTFLGHDASLLAAVSANVVSWFVTTFLPRSSFLARYLSALPPSSQQLLEEEDDVPNPADASRAQELFEGSDARTRCVSIGRPGGVEQLRWVRLKPGLATVGYNVPGPRVPYTVPLLSSSDAPSRSAAKEEATKSETSASPELAAASSSSPPSGGVTASASASATPIPDDCVLLDNRAFSVNYADCCVRWGLYESATRFVGYPIVPGFDVAGIVAEVGGRHADTNNDEDDGSRKPPLQVGDRAFGCTLFGAYSTRVLVPVAQLRRVPDALTLAEAASLPAVSITALYALHLSGHYSLSHATTPTDSSAVASAPAPLLNRNRSILIHSAAGGVGSLLVQMAKILGLSPIVGVVGRPDKVDAAQALGCHVVVDKSSSKSPQDWWESVRTAAPHGYSAIMDPNGAETLRDSYDHLAPTGRLVVFGFHTNLPRDQDLLGPWEWVQMAFRAQKLPKLDAMDLVTSNKSVMGFNLSFLATERDLLAALFDQVLEWLSSGLLECPNIVEMDMPTVAEAHRLIQSGKSVGKIVLTAPTTKTTNATTASVKD